MLSRLARKAVSPLVLPQTSRTAATAVSKNPDPYDDPWDGPERDYVNFPRQKQLDTIPPTRHCLIPESFFQALYPKTGVTGPYMLMFGTGVFMFSKELIVKDHEYNIGCNILCLGILLYNKVGPMLRAKLDEDHKAQRAYLDNIRETEIAKSKDAIKAEEEAQFVASSYEELIQAKKEAVGLQLEAEYRSRLLDAYNQVKKRLDYQLELTNVMRRVEQKHMVDWIISNVRKSITAKQEEDALKKCIADLKSMAK